MPQTKTEAPSRVPPSEKMTWEEFLAWADEDTDAEWVKGAVVMTSPSNLRHQRLELWLASILGQFVRAGDLGDVLQSRFLMRLPVIPSGREPDILFVRKEHLDRLHDRYLEGPADLVIEIISPDSIARDRGDKFAEYEDTAVPEYWLLDPIRKRPEFYQLDENGRYQFVEPDAQGICRSKVVDGFWIRVEWLWRDPLPLEREVLEEIGKGS